VTRRIEAQVTVRLVTTVKVATRGRIAREVSKVWKDGATVARQIVLVLGHREAAVAESAPGHEPEAAEDVASIINFPDTAAHRVGEVNVTSANCYKTSLRVLQPVALAATAGFFLWTGSAMAQQGNEKTFASPGDAVVALYHAVKSNDAQTINAIFGSNAGPILHSGDDVADKNLAANFISKYEQMHRIVQEPDQTVTLYIGAENWPMPIPLVKNGAGAWYFDTETGKQEILYRRVGTNENDAIEILYSLVAAQRDYASTLHDGSNSTHYAAKFFSDTGKENGLYWKTGDNEPASPIGPLLVSASDEGYARKEGQQTPFHGYYYRILTKQGPAAKGGARDYLSNGELARGFAFVTYPAEYRNSGVMTFIVNQDGVVYQKDLGPDTAQVAAGMSEYNPDKSWDPVE
jgi:Protein of unknown function (DUF2950)